MSNEKEVYMGFRTVIVNKHSKLSYKNNHLTYKSETDIQMIHLSEIDTLIVETTDVVITTMLVSKLVENNINVIFCDEKRLPTAGLMPYYGRHDSSLTISKQLMWEDEHKELLAYNILGQKIHNQSLFLAKEGFLEKSDAIERLLNEFELTDPSNREGHAARIFFNTLYGNSFSRDDANDINASLDYGYTIIMSIFAREIVKCGCLTQLGINHHNQFNQYNFASDLMEPFRLIVDEVVYKNKTKSFAYIKGELFKIFAMNYEYDNSQMFLNNIVKHYVKNCIDYLHKESAIIPRFSLEPV